MQRTGEKAKDEVTMELLNSILPYLSGTKNRLIVRTTTQKDDSFFSETIDNEIYVYERSVNTESFDRICRVIDKNGCFTNDENVLFWLNWMATSDNPGITKEAMALAFINIMQLYMPECFTPTILDNPDKKWLLTFIADKMFTLYNQLFSGLTCDFDTLKIINEFKPQVVVFARWNAEPNPYANVRADEYMRFDSTRDESIPPMFFNTPDKVNQVKMFIATLVRAYRTNRGLPYIYGLKETCTINTIPGNGVVYNIIPVYNM